jgi:hypothetical protein
MGLVEEILPLASELESALQKIPRTPQPIYDPGNWVRVEGNRFQLLASREDDGRYVQTWTAIALASQGPGYARALAALDKEPRLAARLNRLVGPANLGQGLQQPSAVLNSILRRVAESNGGSLLERLTTALETELNYRTRETARVMYLAPVCGLDCEAPSVPAGNGATFDKMGDAELAMFIRNGLLVSAFFSLPGLFDAADLCAIRFISEQPIIVHPGSSGGPAPDARLYSAMDDEARQAVQDALTALRLLRRGDVSVAGTLVYCPDFESGWAISPGRQIKGHERHKLVRNDANDLGRLVSLVRAARDDRSINVALRRFGYALERDRAEDRLLDLAIAGEAIFLDDNVEATHKFAQRAALLVESEPTKRHEAFTFLKHVYRIRSKTAHGREFRESDCRSRAGAPITLQQLSAEFEDMIRISLRAVLEAKAAQRWPIDWEALLFGLNSAAP